jgi:hypothetical protein
VEFAKIHNRPQIVNYEIYDNLYHQYIRRYHPYHIKKKQNELVHYFGNCGCDYFNVCIVYLLSKFF